MISTETLERPPSESSPSGGEFERKGSRLWKAGAAILVIAAGAFIFWPRRSQAKSEEGNGTVPIVAAARVSREEIARELVFDSELRPYQEIDIHAKVSGYLENISVDIGDHVKEGQLIATLELPEAEDDLERAKAAQARSEQDVRRAEADYEEARVTLSRMSAISKAQPNLIAQQEIDAITAKAKSAQATLGALREQAKAAAADVKKLKTMLEYTRIVTPFAGVITERYADKGSLIQAGTSAQSIPLVRLSENGKLRLVFPVSVSFVPYIRVGAPVKVEIPGLKRSIDAKITRTAQKVTTSTRTMDTEVEIDNDDYSLIPGMYASVRLDVDRKDHALVVPVEALSRQKKATVYVINKDGIIENRAVKLGLETPSKIEVLGNLQENELVLIGNRSQVKPGQKVIPKVLTEQVAQQPAAQ